MAGKISAYVDTSAFIAFLDRSDTYHALFARLFADPPALITTPLVIAEGHGWFLRRYDITRALRFLSFIEDLTPLTIHPITTQEVQQATKILRSFSGQELTLADAMGLHLMKQLRIRHCWSTDRHLGLSGMRLAIH